MKRIPLADLHFDLTNPRYGPDAPKHTEDKEALDYIMSRFDMSDVLSSISVNGFFDSEPIIGIQNDGGIEIIEGNRRLAACLVLADDPRASEHAKKRESYPVSDKVALDTIPVMVYPADSGKYLLPYLGVRHIVGGRPWDSYAKAYWVAHTLESGGLTLPEIKAMLGDTKGLVERLLLAYRVIQQLQENELFDPDDSVKRGRGSASFPFSLVYNALDDRSLRRWLELPDGEGARQPNPLPAGRLKDAALVVKLICGSRKEDFPPAIKESRNLPALSRAVQNPETFEHLKQRRPLEDVEKETIPPHQRVLEGLVKASPHLEDCSTVLIKAPLSPGDASRLHPTAQKIARLAISIRKALEPQTQPPDEQ